MSKTKSKLTCLCPDNMPILAALNSYIYSTVYAGMGDKIKKLRRSVGLFPVQISSFDEMALLEGYDESLKTVATNALRKAEKKRRGEGVRSNSATSSWEESVSSQPLSSSKPKRKRKEPSPSPLHEGEEAADEGSERPAKKQRKKPAYKPRYRSAPYALLLTLRKQERNQVPFMNKADLCREAQPLADAPLLGTGTTDSKFYTGWSSMNKQLVTNGYVEKRGHPPRFYLTQAGRDLADELIASNPTTVGAAADEDSGLDYDESLSLPSRHNTGAASLSTVIPSMQFSFSSVGSSGNRKVVLCVDKMEQYGRGHNDSARIFDRLRDLTNGSVDWRKLEISDYTWVIQTGGREYASKIMIERKSIDDLYMSIKDGRYYAQKSIMKKMDVLQRYYLIEGPIPLGATANDQAIRTAIANTLAVDGFSLLLSQSPDDTAVQVAKVHREVERLLLSMSDKEWGDYSRSLPTLEEVNNTAKDLRDLCLGDTFAFALTSLPGVGKKAAIRIQECFPTPHLLFEALAKGGGSVSALATLTHEDGRAVLSKTAAESVYRFVTDQVFAQPPDMAGGVRGGN
mmetsp:Transcript_42094/g.108328  ORF Transcript_42094/g.108328 Transcript_42094/m.108328 type:complete len:570 (-) Transcript_42094:876-2585(-)